MTAKTVPHCAKFGVLFRDTATTVQCEITGALVDPTDAMFSDFTGLAAQIWSATTAHLVTTASPEVVFTGVTLEDIRSIPYGGGDFPQTPTAGTNAAGGVPIPTDCALAVKKLTGSFGRSYRGRTFWPIWNSGYLDTQDTVKSAYASGVAIALADWQAAIEGGTYPCTFSVVSFYSNKVLRDPGIATAVTGWAEFDLALDSQRRRLLGRGR